MLYSNPKEALKRTHTRAHVAHSSSSGHRTQIDAFQTNTFHDIMIFGILRLGNLI